MYRIFGAIGAVTLAGALFLAAPSLVNAQGIAEAIVQPGDYHLGVGDKLRVIVYGAPNLGGEFTLGGPGVISLPLIGEVRAAGLTATTLQQEIVTALKDGYVLDPKVNVEVLSYRPYYILGEVNKPGEYPYINGQTVLSAVARAQGFTYRARTNSVMIKRPGDATEETRSLTPTTPVGPGDTIRVRERHF